MKRHIYCYAFESYNLTLPHANYNFSLLQKRVSSTYIRMPEHLRFPYIRFKHFRKNNDNDTITVNCVFNSFDNYMRYIIFTCDTQRIYIIFQGYLLSKLVNESVNATSVSLAYHVVSIMLLYIFLTQKSQYRTWFHMIYLNPLDHYQKQKDAQDGPWV